MLDQNAKKLFVDIINYKINWFDNGIYADNPGVVMSLKEVLRKVTDGSLDWAFDYDNLYESDDPERPTNNKYMDQIPLFGEEITNCEEQIKHREKRLNEATKHMTIKEFDDFYPEWYESYKFLDECKYGYDLASDLHFHLFYDRR